MKKQVLILFFCLITISLVSSFYVPKNCSNVEIEKTWNSLFVENSSQIKIFTNDTIKNGRCQEYFAYKVNGEYVFYLTGEEDFLMEDTTSIAGIKMNATQEFIDILDNLTKISDKNNLGEVNIIENYTNLRDTPLDNLTLNQEIIQNFKGSTGNWEKVEETSSSIENETTYFFANKEETPLYNLSEAGYITINHDFVSKTLFYVNAQTPDVCNSSWTCGNWSNCTNEKQSKTCIDINKCKSNRTETKNCTCTQNWQCTEWSSCVGPKKIRGCTDTNFCNNLTGKPQETMACTEACVPNWQCTGWTPDKCSKTKIQKRNCTDLNSCGTLNRKPDERKSCTYIPNLTWIIILIALIIGILIIGTIFVLKKRIKNSKESPSQRKYIPPGPGGPQKIFQKIIPRLPNIQENKASPRIMPRPILKPIQRPTIRPSYRPIPTRRPPPGRFTGRPRKPF